MAEVRKRKELENYKIDETQFHRNEKNNKIRTNRLKKKIRMIMFHKNLYKRRKVYGYGFVFFAMV